MNKPNLHLINQVKPMDQAERERLTGHRGCVIWMTGLSGSGKSTLARALEQHLVQQGRNAYVLDGDEIRTGLNRDLTFSLKDREENIRRIAEVSAILCRSGVLCITSFISPLRAHRDMARTIVGDSRFHEIFVDAPLAICEQRDPKGLYRKARSGEIPEFTGIDSMYEAPLAPALRLDTAHSAKDQCVEQLNAYLKDHQLV
ncbi:MAG TPA: adenylyl-sulfate kinase [Kiritimatiellia bacterium]|nr:adenylyl-sulfate kinase [Kiritimatiellia bacterium]